MLPYQNWQAKERGNLSKCENIPSEHTAFNYFWSHSNAQGGSRRNSNCVSSVGSRKLQIAEHTMFQFSRSGCGAASSQAGLGGQRGAWKGSRNHAMARAMLCLSHGEITSCAGCSVGHRAAPDAVTVPQCTPGMKEMCNSSSPRAAAAE